MSCSAWSCTSVSVTQSAYSPFAHLAVASNLILRQHHLASGAYACLPVVHASRFNLAASWARAHSSSCLQNAYVHNQLLIVLKGVLQDDRRLSCAPACVLMVAAAA